MSLSNAEAGSGRAGTRERKMISRLDPYKDRFKLVSILVASDLDDEGLLQKLGLFFMEMNTHT